MTIDAGAIFVYYFSFLSGLCRSRCYRSIKCSQRLEVTSVKHECDMHCSSTQETHNIADVDASKGAGYVCYVTLLCLSKRCRLFKTPGLIYSVCESD